MNKERLRAQLEILKWVIRLTYCGMPVSYFRHLILKRHEELEDLLGSDPYPDQSCDDSLTESRSPE